jgi:hypothetical protein
MDVNRSAPVVAEADIEIGAAPERVWDTLVDVERWPQWNSEVKSVTLEGGTQEGSVFRWKTSSGTITSTFQTLDPPRHVAWRGKTLSIKAIHIWTFEQIDGRTSVRTAESFEGLLARLLRRRLQKMLQKTLETGLQKLKAEVERQKTAAA